MTHIFPSCSWSILTLNNIHYRPIVALPPIHNFGVSSCQLTSKKARLLRASSHEPDRPSWPDFRDLALPLNPFDRFIWEGELAGFPRSRVSNRDLVKRTGKFEHFSPVTGNESRMNFSQLRMRHMVDNGARTRSQDLRAFFNLRNRGEISHTNPRRN